MSIIYRVNSRLQIPNFNYLVESCNRLDYTYQVLEELLYDYDFCEICEVGAFPFLLSNVLMQNEAVELTSINHPLIYTSDYFNEELMPNYDTIKKQDHTLFSLKESKNKRYFKDYRFDIEQVLPDKLSNKFDVLICTEVVEHLPYNPNIAFYNLNKLLKAGGKIIFSVPNSLFWGNISDIVYGKGPFNIYKDLIYDRHHYEYTMKEVQLLLEKYGFNILNLRTVTFEAFPKEKNLDSDLKVETEFKGVPKEDNPSVTVRLAQKLFLTLLKRDEKHSGKTIFALGEKIKDIEKNESQKSPF